MKRCWAIISTLYHKLQREVCDLYCHWIINEWQKCQSQNRRSNNMMIVQDDCTRSWPLKRRLQIQYQLHTVCCTFNMFASFLIASFFHLAISIICRQTADNKRTNIFKMSMMMHR
jgi:hypothetical protein